MNDKIIQMPLIVSVLFALNPIKEDIPFIICMSRPGYWESLNNYLL